MHISDESESSDPLKEAALAALKRVLDPLMDVMFDTGITVREFSRMIRDTAVRSASVRIARESGRSSYSRIAIITGLARAEVARIMETSESSIGARIEQHPVRRVLAAWHDNQRFLGAAGDPAVLPIFGRKRSFEQLVAVHSGGIPVRAMLDQLLQINAVELVSGLRVKAKTKVPIFKGMTRSAIANIGERAGDLLSTLKNNLHTTATPLFEGTALMCDVDINVLPLVRRQMAEQGATLIEGASSLLGRSRVKSKRSSSKELPQCRAGITVYYFEDERARGPSGPSMVGKGRRKNLRRRTSKSRIAGKA
jgi:hypothetical protein